MGVPPGVSRGITHLTLSFADIGALSDHLGWERPVLLGHSRGGSFALRYATAFQSAPAE